tara:strand:- start:1136 stop:1471 length:336 start_codon:yes stop_codon:yes gene_type:complete
LVCTETAETLAGSFFNPILRILLKIAYVISDQTYQSAGATVLVLVSNRLTGPPSVDDSTGAAHGSVALYVKPGTAFLFEQRTLHGVGGNWSPHHRRTVFFGYTFCCIKPMD